MTYSNFMKYYQLYYNSASFLLLFSYEEGQFNCARGTNSLSSNGNRASLPFFLSYSQTCQYDDRRVCFLTSSRDRSDSEFSNSTDIFPPFLSILFRSIRNESSSQLTNETYFESLKLCFFK